MARILIAEDEPDVRTFVMRALGGAGHETEGPAMAAKRWRRFLARGLKTALTICC